MEGATLSGPKSGLVVRPCGVCTPASAGVEEEIEEAKRERRGIRSHTPIVAYIFLLTHKTL